MTGEQLAILNSMVTFAAENIPRGLSPEEQEVARIVGQWVVQGEGPALNFSDDVPCTCAEDRPGGPPDYHSATCAWGIVEQKSGAQTHVYRQRNASGYGKDVAEAANVFAATGWRVVGVVSDTRPGHSHSLILERPVGVTHPND